MSPIVYQIIHLLALLTLTAGAFYSFAGAPETKKKVMIITGIASLLMLVSGFALLAKLHNNEFAPWVVLKLVAWLGVSALAGIGYRKRDKACLFMGLIGAFLFLGIFTVYYQRFKL